MRSDPRVMWSFGVDVIYSVATDSEGEADCIVFIIDFNLFWFILRQYLRQQK